MVDQSSSTKAITSAIDRALDRTQEIPLPEPTCSNAVSSAQRFLYAGRDSVDSALFNMRLTREIKKEALGHGPRGRPDKSEVDLLRAAIVFAGATLDTTLKELIRSAVPILVESNQQALERFERFATDYIDQDTPRRSKSLAQVLIDPRGARVALLDRYAYFLTGESLQSVTQVSNTASALGITNKDLRRRMTKKSVLDEMFRARNQIVHELDLRGRNSRKRTVQVTRKWVCESLSVGQEIINTVAAETSGSR